MNEEQKGLIQKYRQVFISPLGLEVLGDILAMCHYGQTLDPANPMQVAEHNVGLNILARLGVYAPGTRMQVINKLMEVIPDYGGSNI